MSIKRRTFLQLSGLGAVAVAAGSLTYRVGGVWWDQQAAPELLVLSAREANIVGAIGDTMFPGDGRGMPTASQAGIVGFFDDYLAMVDEQTANLLRLLLHAIDEMAIFGGSGFTRFHRRPHEERLQILAAWDGSMFAARRSAFKSLKFVLSTGYCENPVVLRAAGIEFSCGGAA